MQTIYNPQNGIYGYAPQAESGFDGQNGNNIHYTSYTSEFESSIVSIVAAGSSLVPEIQESTVYSNNDLIVTKDGSVYQISNVDTYPSISKVGSIKIPSSGIYEGDPSQASVNVNFEIQTNMGNTSKNDYNYVEGCESPLYHHRDSIDCSVYGNFIACTSNLTNIINGFDGQYMKLVLLFSSGSRLERVLTTDNYTDPIFVDNRYLLTYGHADVSGVYNTFTINSYDDEKAQSTSTNLRDNLKSSGTKSMTNGYVEYSYLGKTYRKTITIS